MTVYKSTSENQQGVVSIVVTMIIMVVLTLVVTVFDQLARRDQREVLDRQLCTQALYAAESGINDAQSRVVSDAANGVFYNANDCDDYGSLTNLGTADAVTTCILVNTTPRSIVMPN